MANRNANGKSWLEARQGFRPDFRIDPRRVLLAGSGWLCALLYLEHLSDANLAVSAARAWVRFDGGSGGAGGTPHAVQW